MEGLPTNPPDLDEPCPIYILIKETEIPKGPTTDVSKLAPWFMLQIYFSFFNIESIRGFTLNFFDKWCANSYPFGFPSISRRLLLYIFKFLVTTLRNQDKKVAFIGVDKYEALSKSS